MKGFVYILIKFLLCVNIETSRIFRTILKEPYPDELFFQQTFSFF